MGRRKTNTDRADTTRNKIQKKEKSKSKETGKIRAHE